MTLELIQTQALNGIWDLHSIQGCLISGTKIRQEI